jgi:hypothetical protein
MLVIDITTDTFVLMIGQVRQLQEAAMSLKAGKRGDAGPSIVMGQMKEEALSLKREAASLRDELDAQREEHKRDLREWDAKMEDLRGELEGVYEREGALREELESAKRQIKAGEGAVLGGRGVDGAGSGDLDVKGMEAVGGEEGASEGLAAAVVHFNQLVSLPEPRLDPTPVIFNRTLEIAEKFTIPIHCAFLRFNCNPVV